VKTRVILMLWFVLNSNNPGIQAHTKKGPAQNRAGPELLLVLRRFECN
jgi:hypothetical protein